MAKIQIKALPLPGLPDVSIDIGGKERQLAYDFAAIVKAEELTGINLMQAVSFQNLSFTQVRGMLSAALLKEEPTLNISELDGWLHVRNFSIVLAAVAEAWYGSVPESKDDAPAGEDKAQTNEV